MYGVLQRSKVLDRIMLVSTITSYLDVTTKLKQIRCINNKNKGERMSDVTQTITIRVLDEETMRREMLAEVYAANARTKLMLAKNPNITKEQKIKLVKEAKQDIQDGMSILRSGFVRPFGCYPL